MNQHVKYSRNVIFSPLLYVSLPPYEVWGKLMFLHLCVILFTWGRGSASRGLHPGGGVSHPGGGDMHPGKGVCIQWGGGRHLGTEVSFQWGGVCIQGGKGVYIPPIRYYGVWSTSGRYVSYWNAFLLL